MKGRLYMPIYAMKRTTESANLRYGTPGYGMSAYKGGDDKLQSFSMSCDSSMIKGTPPGV